MGAEPARSRTGGSVPARNSGSSDGVVLAEVADAEGGPAATVLVLTVAAETRLQGM